MNIITMISYQTLILAAFVYYFDSMPNWLRGVLLFAWAILCYFAYASEEKLRDRVKKLEDEAKHNSTEKGWDE